MLPDCSHETTEVISGDPLKTMIYATGGLAVAALLYFGPYGGKPLSEFTIILYRSLAVFLAGISVFLIATMFKPKRLVLSEQGIQFSTWFRIFRYRWEDIADIEYKKFTTGYAATYWIMISLKPNHMSGPKQLGTGKNSGIIDGRGWPMSAHELADHIVEKWHRWKVVTDGE